VKLLVRCDVLGASASTEGGEGRGHIVAAAGLQLFEFNVVRTSVTKALVHGIIVAFLAPSLSRTVVIRIGTQVRRVKVQRLIIHYQWRSKALRGRGLTVTWGPSLSLPSTFPPSPSSPLSLLFPSPAPPPAAKRPPKSSYGSGRALYAPSAEPQPKSNLVHFILKICRLVTTILMIFLRVSPKIFLWPHYSGAPGDRGPGSLNRLNPPVPTPLSIITPGL